MHHVWSLMKNIFNLINNMKPNRFYCVTPWLLLLCVYMFISVFAFNIGKYYNQQTQYHTTFIHCLISNIWSSKPHYNFDWSTGIFVVNVSFFILFLLNQTYSILATGTCIRQQNMHFIVWYNSWHYSPAVCFVSLYWPLWSWTGAQRNESDYISCSSSSSCLMCASAKRSPAHFCFVSCAFC